MRLLRYGLMRLYTGTWSGERPAPKVKYTRVGGDRPQAGREQGQARARFALGEHARSPLARVPGNGALRRSWTVPETGTRSAESWG